MEQTLEDRATEALDAIDEATSDLRELLDAEPIREAADDVKAALETFVTSVGAALAQARSVLGGEEEEAEPEEGSEPASAEGETQG